MSKIFDKIDIKFYFNFIAHNQTYEHISYSVITYFISNNKILLFIL